MLSVRRSAAALAVGAALVTAGCGGPAAPGRAAIVDGRVISEDAVQSAMTQVNAMNPQLLRQQLTPTGTLSALVQAPVVLSFLEGKGITVSESVAQQQAAKSGLTDPSASTLEVIRLATAISQAQGKVTQTDGEALTAQLKELDVDVNPRYGAYDENTGSIQLTTPSWVKPLDAAQ